MLQLVFIGVAQVLQVLNQKKVFTKKVTLLFICCIFHGGRWNNVIKNAFHFSVAYISLVQLKNVVVFQMLLLVFLLQTVPGPGGSKVKDWEYYAVVTLSSLTTTFSEISTSKIKVSACLNSVIISNYQSITIHH